MAHDPSKVDAIRSLTGLPSRSQMLNGNTDNTPATIVDPSTGAKAPAALTQGEFVFSIPSIIGLGEGDYQKGLDSLTHLHDKLKQIGTQLIGSEQTQAPAQGLAAAGPEAQAQQAPAPA